jgi:hypothetical protein
MTARPRLQTVTARSSPAPQARAGDKLRRQLLVERIFFIALVVVLGIIAVRQARALRMYQVSVNGQPVAIVGDAATANRLLREVRGDTPDARFRQTVLVQRANPRAMVMTEAHARNVLAAAINVIVPAYVILADGKVRAALATRVDAEQVVSRLRRSGASPSTLSSVRIEEANVSRARIVSRDEALRGLTSGARAPSARRAAAPSAPRARRR